MTRASLYVLAIFSGLAGLSWELLWQMKAPSTPVTLGGMALGSFLTHRLLSHRPRINPLQVFALLQLIIGLAGLLLTPGFAYFADLKATRWVLLGPPAAALGATIPIYGLLGKNYRVPIATLYGLNLAGAALGCLLLVFVSVPQLGVQTTISLVALVSFVLCLCAALLAGRDNMLLGKRTDAEDVLGRWEMWVAFLTGLATLSLEIAWFRCLRGVFSATAESFALMLAAVLLAQALGARRARSRPPLGPLLCSAGLAILLVTPLVERVDAWPTGNAATRLLLCLALLGPPMTLLGAGLPTLLQRRTNLKVWAHLYALHSLGALAGWLLATRVLLPQLGLVMTAWLTGVMVGAMGATVWKRPPALLAVALATALAYVGRTGAHLSAVQEGKIVLFSEGPDYQTVVWELPDGTRRLFIDGASVGPVTHWMGRVPMLLHSSPRTALVIGLGTGQPLQGVLGEGIETVDLVENNPGLLQSATLLTNVLEDARVHSILMDGRAWVRSTDHRYDVAALVPMPSDNALYSLEFYHLLANRLNPGGLVAQWLPLDLERPEVSVSIVSTFQAVFGDSIVWIGPDGDCLLVGRVTTDGPALATEWPGLARTAEGRDLREEVIRQSGWMDQDALDFYTTLGDGRLVTDDNQLLAYGQSQRHLGNDGQFSLHQMERAYNVKVLRRASDLAVGQEPMAALLTELQAQLESGRRPEAWSAVKEARGQLTDPKFQPLVDTLGRLRLP